MKCYSSANFQGIFSKSDDHGGCSLDDRIRSTRSTPLSPLLKKFMYELNSIQHHFIISNVCVVVYIVVVTKINLPESDRDSYDYIGRK